MGHLFNGPVEYFLKREVTMTTEKVGKHCFRKLREGKTSLPSSPIQSGIIVKSSNLLQLLLVFIQKINRLIKIQYVEIQT